MLIMILLLLRINLSFSVLVFLNFLLIILFIYISNVIFLPTFPSIKLLCPPPSSPSMRVLPWFLSHWPSVPLFWKHQDLLLNIAISISIHMNICLSICLSIHLDTPPKSPWTPKMESFHSLYVHNSSMVERRPVPEKPNDPTWGEGEMFPAICLLISGYPPGLCHPHALNSAWSRIALSVSRAPHSFPVLPRTVSWMLICPASMTSELTPSFHTCPHNIPKSDFWDHWSTRSPLLAS